MTFSALDGDHGSRRREGHHAPHLRDSSRPRRAGRCGAESLPTLHEACGYFRTYTPEGGGPFGRKITEPYTEWVRSHARGARTSGGAAP